MEEGTDPIISDILKKSKDTLRSISFYVDIDLSPLRDSTQLRKLKINGLISSGNFEIIRTFSNLVELGTKDQKLVGLFKESKTLKTLIYKGPVNTELLDCFPQSVTKLSITAFDGVKEFLEKTPFVKELTIELDTHKAATLLNQFKQVIFNFIIPPSLFTFSQCYSYLHPEYKQIVIPGSEPDHVLYELLFKQIADKRMLLGPYLSAADKWDVQIDQILNAPPEFMKYLATFNEFKYCLRKDNLRSHYFEEVFNQQMSTYDNDEYLLIIVSAYDEVFQLQADIDNTVTIIKGMGWTERENLKRERFFHHCRHNWIEPLTEDDFNKSEEFEEPEEY